MNVLEPRNHTWTLIRRIFWGQDFSDCQSVSPDAGHSVKQQTNTNRKHCKHEHEYTAIISKKSLKKKLNKVKKSCDMAQIELLCIKKK